MLPRGAHDSKEGYAVLLLAEKASVHSGDI